MPCRVCILFCCLILGCGTPKLHAVRAVVTFDGKPLVGAEVLLLSVQNDTGSASGITDMEGKVAFQTSGEEGVFPGTYVVIVSKIVEEQMLSNSEIRALAEIGIQYKPAMIELIPEKYTRRETSDLKMTVGYWHTKNAVFDIQSEKPLLRPGGN